MTKDVHARARKKMDTSIESLRHELQTVRTGRASLALLDDVRVENYGQAAPLNQVANLSIPEGNLIMIQPWNPGQIADIERAIMKANLGLTPSSDGKVVRVPVPPLTEERRREMAKRVAHLGEEGKTAVRNVRRDANEEIKKLEKDKGLAQDDAKKALQSIQDLTDEYVAKIDTLVKAKEKEVLEF
jgi:ribosome recycling factor